MLTARIREIHKASRSNYGVPRMYAVLVDEGVRIGRMRIARLMRQPRLQGTSRCRKVRTTIRKPDGQVIPDLVERNFTAEWPDRMWGADITYVPTRAEFLYLAVVLNA